MMVYGTNCPKKAMRSVESRNGSQYPGLKIWLSTNGRASEMATEVMMREARSQFG